MKKINLEVENWVVFTMWDRDVPKKVLKELKRKGNADLIHGNWGDCLILHGDDGGWCVDAPEYSPEYKFLERVRKATGYAKKGFVFRLLIKSE